MEVVVSRREQSSTVSELSVKLIDISQKLKVKLVGEFSHFRVDGSDLGSGSKPDEGAGADLNAAPFHAPKTTSRRGLELHNEFQRRATNDFRDMKPAQCKIRSHKYVMDPSIGQPIKIVVWPPTKKAKIIPIPKDLPDESLDDLKYWCYYPV
ncbi:hypothetical protein QVD17_37994 [Tagetes erecta]|uniref:Uncharacterized protein n=1 Tax=Tagetes erecta TaxID=13708 RepID=A0AAD8K1L0_TARER|nr:hypothetical protein QVD17_37994 [Tagetes erecta]